MQNNQSNAVLFNKIFIRLYSLYGGIWSDNSNQTYIVHYLYFLQPLAFFPPHLKQLQEVFVIFFFFYYSYVHTRLGSFLPPAPTPSLTTHSTPSHFPPPPQYPAETILPLFLILL
jgi:hypothetical protein